MEEVWIDPVAYRAELSEAVSLLAKRGVRTMIYNHQLCLIDHPSDALTKRDVLRV